MEVDPQLGAATDPGSPGLQCPAPPVVRSRFFGAELRPHERLDAPPPATTVLATSRARAVDPEILEDTERPEPPRAPEPPGVSESLRETEAPSKTEGAARPSPEDSRAAWQKRCRTIFASLGSH